METSLACKYNTPRYGHDQNHQSVSRQDARNAYDRVSTSLANQASKLEGLTTLASIQDPILKEMYIRKINTELTPKEREALPIPAFIRSMASKGPEESAKMVDFVSALDFNDVSFKGANFNGSHLNGLELSNVCLEEADFGNAKLENCKFHGVSISESTFSGSELHNTTLTGCDLFDSNMTNTCQHDTTYDGCHISNVPFDKSLLKNVAFVSNGSSKIDGKCSFEELDESSSYEFFNDASAIENRPEQPRPDDENASYVAHPFTSSHGPDREEPNRERNNVQPRFSPISGVKFFDGKREGTDRAVVSEERIARTSKHDQHGIDIYDPARRQRKDPPPGYT
ncbi:pentapeptide repeat-containing protein [Dyella sp. M7H15-1]|uniref:pentapeptide repeat-containing protein n=1 Tax=Dyella sp. M7H15-1 TaxID=2501295 RepID=UPI001005217D|nr:pentapeptide repeat-containing protein [Dyella sp. M7H15-1]QAU25227.1 pentapeptide repeat-containing protein [Dyella sp. M7H15-1]